MYLVAFYTTKLPLLKGVFYYCYRLIKHSVRVRCLEASKTRRASILRRSVLGVHD